LDNNLKNQLQDDMKAAMKNGDKLNVVTLRSAISAIKLEEINSRSSLTNEKVLSIISRLCKQRRESIEQYTKANRKDLAIKEENELLLLSQYLPSQLNETEIKEMVQKTITDMKATSVKDIGKVMAALSKDLNGKADLGAVSKIVKRTLVES
tara:strand:+ start:946 stop:1401 length:456 start_codon:yes stop_codon:yes gene_type:complete